jgi:hemolysin III
MTQHMNEALRSGLDSIAESVADVKPKLRGWIHLATAPLALAGGIVLVLLSPDATTRWGSALFSASALVLFTVSAVYHTGSWSPRVWAFLRRFDHANIFVLIAGSYTPLTLILLEGTQRTVLLSTIWTTAILGVLFRVFWTDAPRWLYTPIYIAMGWVAIVFLPDFAQGASERLGGNVGTAVMVLIATGGALYTLGGVVYGLRRPDPWPRWFGFHEVFHTFTILAFLTHYVGISMATYALR